MHRYPSISFTRAQGVPRYKIGFGRGKGWVLCCVALRYAMPLNAMLAVLCSALLVLYFNGIQVPPNGEHDRVPFRPSSHGAECVRCCAQHVLVGALHGHWRHPVVPGPHCGAWCTIRSQHPCASFMVTCADVAYIALHCIALHLCAHFYSPTRPWCCPFSPP